MALGDVRMDAERMILSSDMGEPLVSEEIDTKVLQRNVSCVLDELHKNRYKNSPPAKLIAVTKTVPPGTINCLKPLQILDIAENRVQSALPKLPKIAPEFRLHWIGRLQTNKVKDIIEHVYMLHAMDRLSLAQEVERRAGGYGRVLPVLIQVNIAGETQKAGMNVTEVRPFIHRIKCFSNIHVKGLMSILPLEADAPSLAMWFRGMRTLFDQLRNEAIDNVDMDELSMGMSNDFAIAAREGATMVRVGTALFQPWESTP